MDIDPNELVGPLVRGWPLVGRAADWILDLETGRFGELKLRIGRIAVVKLLNFDDCRREKLPRGPASVRLEIGFEDDDDIPDDDDADIEWVIDICLSWSELIDTGDDGSTPVRRPLVKMPSRELIPRTALNVSYLKEVFGEPTFSEALELRPNEVSLEWLRDGFLVSASTDCGILTSVGISALGLLGDPPLRLVP